MQPILVYSCSVSDNRSQSHVSRNLYYWLSNWLYPQGYYPTVLQWHTESLTECNPKYWLVLRTESIFPGFGLWALNFWWVTVSDDEAMIGPSWDSPMSLMMVWWFPQIAVTAQICGRCWSHLNIRILRQFESIFTLFAFSSCILTTRWFWARAFFSVVACLNHVCRRR